MDTFLRVIIFFSILLLCGCGNKIPEFDSNQAFIYLQKQCDLGYRLPGSPEIELCRDFIISEMQHFGADVSKQSFKAEVAGKELEGINIIAKFYPQLSRRVLLGAHYDTRPWSDKEADMSLHEIPVTGANDGASGVAVLMEIGRL